MKYVYLVFDENHGLQGVYDSELKACVEVLRIAINDYGFDVSRTPPDYDDSPNCWGWEGISWWYGKEVK